VTDEIGGIDRLDGGEMAVKPLAELVPANQDPNTGAGGLVDRDRRESGEDNHVDRSIEIGQVVADPPKSIAADMRAISWTNDVWDWLKRLAQLL